MYVQKNCGILCIIKVNLLPFTVHVFVHHRRHVFNKNENGYPGIQFPDFGYPVLKISENAQPYHTHVHIFLPKYISFKSNNTNRSLQ